MSSTNYRSDIQGLRAIAVLAVMVFHFNPEWLSGGFIGVDIFLVISGFLITSILLDKKAKADYTLLSTLTYFYGSRIRRIVPAYFVMLVLVTLVAAVFFLPQDFDTFKKGLEKAAWFNSNNYFAGFGDYFAPANYEQPLLHTWSLAIEIQFYLLAPFILLLMPKRILPWLLGVVLLVFILIAEYRLRILGVEQQTYYSLYARLPEFFIGALTALYLNNQSTINSYVLQWTGFTALITAILLQPMLGPFPGLLVLIPSLGTAALLASRPVSQSIITRFLSNKFMVWVGALSYSLYLWHWPVLAFLRYYIGAELLDWQYSILFVVLTLTLSMVSYHCVEELLRKRSAPKLRWAAYTGLATVMIGTGLGAKKVNAYFSPDPLPVEYTRYADPATICHGQIVGDCLKGDLTSDKEVLVLGDSHAAMLNHFFDYLGKELGFKARVITASSCVTIPGFSYNHIAESMHKACLSQIEVSKLYIEQASHIFIAASWVWQLESKEFHQSIESFLKSEKNKNVYLLAQEPLLKKNPQRMARLNNLGLEPRMAINKKYRQANEYLKSLASDSNNVDYINFESSGIFRTAPFYFGSLLYFDQHHLNEIGAILYAQTSQQLFKKLSNDF